MAEVVELEETRTHVIWRKKSLQEVSTVQKAACVCVCVLFLNSIDWTEEGLCYQLTLYNLIKVILDTVSSC